MSQNHRGTFKYHFAQSTYISAAWDWFMIFAGKAAEPVLTASVLYSCARLLPGVHIPVQVDNIVFIAQMVALDVAGLSLGKMAKVAQQSGNTEGATLAKRVSLALISIMIANVVLSVLQTIIPSMPGQLIAVVEAILLIARAIMAVLYAHVLHGLKGTHTEHVPPALPVIDEWALVALGAFLQEQTEQTIATLKAEQQQAMNNFQQNLEILQNQTPTVDTQAIAENVLASLESRFTSEMRAFQANLRQQVTISSALDETRRLDKTEFQFRRSGEFNQLPPTKQQNIQASNGFSQEIEKQSDTNTEKIRPLHALESRETQVVRLWNEDRSRSTQTIAALTGVPKSTVAYYLKPYRDQLENNSTPSSETTA